jgi:glycosyltransferase involved in cell wall biosynthesis
VEVVRQLAEALPDLGFHLIGGAAGAPAEAAPTLPANLHRHGYIAPRHVPACLKAMDLLLMPYQLDVRGASGRSNLADWMSPLKMFEYMAAGRAIVASDLPALREVLRHEENALLVPATDLEAWGLAVRRLAADPELRKRLGKIARSQLESRYTWDARAERVLSGIA